VGVKSVNKTKIAERFNSEKYGMTFCPGCSGSGRVYNDAQGFNVCKVCGGFGFIKKEDKNSFQYDRVIAQLLK
jgi:DnaJ-class molecular chaperone